MDLAPPGDLRAALVGRTILYWWPEDGWQRGTVARPCPRGGFSHVVAGVHPARAGRRRRCAARRTRCSTPPPTASVGCCSPRPLLPGSPGPPTRRLRLAALAGPPDRDFQFGRWLVTTPARASGPSPGRRPLWKLSSRRMFCGSFCGLSEAAEDSRCNGCPIKSVSERRSERENRMSDLQSPASDRAPIADTPARSDYAPIADTPARASVSTNVMVVKIYATAAGDPGSNPALGKHHDGHVTTRSSSPGQPRRSPMLTLWDFPF